jgi:hypothetical protein
MHILLACLFLGSPAFANSTGITGRSTAGCGNCHGAAASAQTTATLSATSRTLAPGASTNVTLRVRSTNAARTYAGLNAAASGGTLAAGSNTALSGTEITHSAPQLLTAGSITFRFRWTAPASPGAYSITAAGNAVNNNGASSGDGWRVATALSMTVSSAFTSDGAEEEEEAADDAAFEGGDEAAMDLPPGIAELHGWGASDEGAEEEDAGDYLSDDPSENGDDGEANALEGCSTGATAPGLGVILLAGLALARRRG